MEITIHEEKISHFTFHDEKKGRSRVTKITFTTLFNKGKIWSDLVEWTCFLLIYLSEENWSKVSSYKKLMNATFEKCVHILCSIWKWGNRIKHELSIIVRCCVKICLCLLYLSWMLLSILSAKGTDPALNKLTFVSTELFPRKRHGETNQSYLITPQPWGL